MSDTDRTSAPSLAGAAWLIRPETQRVLGVLEDAGHGARVVGGAVRNALLGRPVKDIDIATTAAPGLTIQLMTAAGLKTVPTGLAHGTVTVVVEHEPFEVTTLRRDVETFGRHATVAFTGDWAEDARRRDFTINALYCDREGLVHDPLATGTGDIAARRVRFIGDPHDRIREDYLRILRFFRFTAEYAHGLPDAAGLAACAEMKDGLDKLSGERIRQELLRLIVARHASDAVRELEAAGLFSHILPVPVDTAKFRRVAEIEKGLGRAPDAILRLGVLAMSGPRDAATLRDRLKLSNHEFERLANMRMSPHRGEQVAGINQAKEYLYRYGAEAFVDHLLFGRAQDAELITDDWFLQLVTLPARWPVPERPIRGSDLLALGVPAGPLVGQILSQFEEWWIAAGFPDNAVLLAAELRRLAVVTNS